MVANGLRGICSGTGSDMTRGTILGGFLRPSCSSRNFSVHFFNRHKHTRNAKNIVRTTRAGASGRNLSTYMRMAKTAADTPRRVATMMDSRMTDRFDRGQNPASCTRPSSAELDLFIVPTHSSAEKIRCTEDPSNQTPTDLIALHLPWAIATVFPYSWTQPSEGLQPDDIGLFIP